MKGTVCLGIAHFSSPFEQDFTCVLCKALVDNSQQVGVGEVGLVAVHVEQARPLISVSLLNLINVSMDQVNYF